MSAQNNNEDRILERLVALETKIESAREQTIENERQQKANWARLDELRSGLETAKISAVETNARNAEKLANMEKMALRESFGMKTQIAEIAWRVGILMAGAVLIINFFMSKINLTGLLTDTKTTQETRRKR